MLTSSVAGKIPKTNKKKEEAKTGFPGGKVSEQTDSVIVTRLFNKSIIMFFINNNLIKNQNTLLFQFSSLNIFFSPLRKRCRKLSVLSVVKTRECNSLATCYRYEKEFPIQFSMTRFYKIPIIGHSFIRLLLNYRLLQKDML